MLASILHLDASCHNYGEKHAIEITSCINSHSLALLITLNSWKFPQLIPNSFSTLNYLSHYIH